MAILWSTQGGEHLSAQHGRTFCPGLNFCICSPRVNIVGNNIQDVMKELCTVFTCKLELQAGPVRSLTHHVHRQTKDLWAI